MKTLSEIEICVTTIMRVNIGQEPSVIVFLPKLNQRSVAFYRLAHRFVVKGSTAFDGTLGPRNPVSPRDVVRMKCFSDEVICDFCFYIMIHLIPIFVANVGFTSRA